MEGLLEFFNNHKLVDIGIILVGLFGAVLIVERFKALFFDYPMDSEKFTNQILDFIRQDKVEEAVSFCAANEKKPLAYVTKKILEKSDRDDKALYQALDIASAEVGPKLVKGLGHLAMVANVVTLIGLLGTVTGLITAFRAISFADVSQKQVLLAQGISMAMSATALGLMTAIPIMFIYSFLHAKQGRLFSDMDRVSNKVIEALESRFYKHFSESGAYPGEFQKDAAPSMSKVGAPRPAAPKPKAS